MTNSPMHWVHIIRSTNNLEWLFIGKMEEIDESEGAPSSMTDRFEIEIEEIEETEINDDFISVPSSIKSPASLSNRSRFQGTGILKRFFNCNK